jgi:hypothetical protein
MEKINEPSAFQPLPRPSGHLLNILYKKIFPALLYCTGCLHKPLLWPALTPAQFQLDNYCGDKYASM